MRRGVYLVFAALSVLMLAALSGCHQIAGTQIDEEGNTASRIVVDAYGREVAVPDQIDSAAVYGRGAARMVVYAGAVDKLIGVSDMDKEADPWMPYALANEDLFASLPSVGAGGSKDIAYEEVLVDLQPSIIVSTYGNSENQLLQSKTGIPVVGLACQNLVFDQEFYDSIILLGNLLGTGERARQVVESVEAYQSDLNARTSDVSSSNRVSAYVGGVNYLGPKSLDGTFSGYEPFDVVGVRNVVDGTCEAAGAVNIDLEMLGEWDPDVIFVNPLNLSMIKETYSANAEYLDSISAIAEGHIYAQPAFNYNGTNVELAIANAYYVGKVAYPDRFTDVDIAQKTDEIFIALVGCPLYNRMELAGMGFSEIDIRR